MTPDSNNLAASGEFDVITGTPVAPVDLRTAWPGYATGTGTMKKRPRAIMYNGGALNVTLEDGTAVTLPAIWVDRELPISPAAIAGGSTATTVLVIW